MAVLEQGGNAFDAAVAAGLTLQVVEPDMNGPGGDLPAILWPAGRSEPVVLCAQGPAPQRATVKYYRDDLGLRHCPRDGPARRGRARARSAAGWQCCAISARMHLRDVARFAIGYAADGYPMLARTSFGYPRFGTAFSGTSGPPAAMFTSRLRRPGGLARNLALGATYERVVQEAEARSPSREGQIEAALDIWYRGWVAEAIVNFQGQAWMDTSGDRHTGPAERRATWPGGSPPTRSP